MMITGTDDYSGDYPGDGSYWSSLTARGQQCLPFNATLSGEASLALQKHSCTRPITIN